jgi:putative drug exporter of the RND superfamily
MRLTRPSRTHSAPVPWRKLRTRSERKIPRPALLASVGGFSVRHSWWVISAWVVFAGAATVFLPSIGSVTNNDNSALLPSSSASTRAQELAQPLLGIPAASGVLVATSNSGFLDAADQQDIERIAQATRRVDSVVKVSDGPVSADGEARTLDVEFLSTTGGGGTRAARAVQAIRLDAERLSTPDLQVHLTGTLPELVDQQQAGSRTALRVELFTAVFILALLLLAFRSTLAPLITLAPAGLALLAADPVVAESTKIGVHISSLLELLLTALILGAGTDYGLFLMFRYKENLQRGLEPRQAIVSAVERVGTSVTFSAATVIAALLTLLLASFGLYRGIGPGLAIGIAIVLIVELTFFPALLAVVGSIVFWPSTPRPGEPRPGTWGAVAARVSTRPVLAVVCGTVVFGTLAFGLLGYAPSGFNPGAAIVGSDSAEGLAALEQHFGIAALGLTDVVFKFDEPIWNHMYLLQLGEQHLQSSGEFSSIGDALDAGGIDLPPSLVAGLHRVLGPPQSLPSADSSTNDLSPCLYDAYRSTAAFITADGRTVLYKTSLTAGSPGTTAALQAIPGIRSTVSQVGALIGASENGVAGQAAGAADVARLSGADIVRIAPVVLLVLGLILALVLRSLVAPLYLVLSVALSYIATLGLAVIIFVGIDRELGVNFTLPFFMFVFIMALGEDYNILVMNRIREEAARRDLRQAVSVGIGMTGTTVTSAGLVLSGTFGVLAIGSSGQIRQIATGLALGILLDTFVVRTLLVPSTVVLLGRWNWWPSTMSRRLADETAAPLPVAPVPAVSSSEHVRRVHDKVVRA